jgi:arginase
MIYINPQWQGSGSTDALKTGAETFLFYFKNVEIPLIPLSDKACTLRNNVLAFDPILEQAHYFKEKIEDEGPIKISTLGGDCGIEIIPISYLNKLYKNDLCVLWIDAHADLNTPESSPSKTFHGMPLRTLLGEGNQEIIDVLYATIKPKQICYLGLRDLDKPEEEYIKENNITSIQECAYGKIENKLSEFANIYIHLDLDILDKSEFPHTLFPSSNGFRVAEVAKLLKKMKANHNVVGFCITESIANLEQLEIIRPILDELEL